MRNAKELVLIEATVRMRNALDELRKQAGITHKEWARRAGVSNMTIVRLMQGKSVQWRTLVQLAMALGVMPTLEFAELHSLAQ